MEHLNFPGDATGMCRIPLCCLEYLRVNYPSSSSSLRRLRSNHLPHAPSCARRRRGTTQRLCNTCTGTCPPCHPCRPGSSRPQGPEGLVLRPLLRHHRLPDGPLLGEGIGGGGGSEQPFRLPAQYVAQLARAPMVRVPATVAQPMASSSRVVLPASRTAAMTRSAIFLARRPT
jgi:hypothetical protein